MDLSTICEVIGTYFIPIILHHSILIILATAKNMDYCGLVAGIPTPLKNDGVKVSWDDLSFPI